MAWAPRMRPQPACMDLRVRIVLADLLALVVVVEQGYHLVRVSVRVRVRARVRLSSRVQVVPLFDP